MQGQIIKIISNDYFVLYNNTQIKEKKWQEIEKLCEKSNFPRIKNC